MTSYEIPSDVVGRRVREVREARRLSVKQLAERCDASGYELSAQALYNLENGRRDEGGRRRRLVTVDELLALAAALDVAPVHLLVPPLPSPGWDSNDELNDTVLYSVTPKRSVPLYLVRRFVRGDTPLPGMDQRQFYSEIPPHEFSPLLIQESDRGERR